MPTAPATKLGTSHKSSQATKRKVAKDDDDDESGDEAGSDVEMLDVSFDFFDPQPHDYHSIKLLLSQLMSHDAHSLDMGAVTDLVLQQKLVGSTIKTDGNEGDPYAVLTVLNLNVHKDTPCIASLVKYLLNKLQPNAALHSLLSSLLAVSAADSTPAKPRHVGLVLSERLVNMPAQIMPPAYKMLQEELQWAREDKEPYDFSHLLFISRAFLASSESFDEDPNAALNANAAVAGGDTTSSAAQTKSVKKKSAKKAKKGSHTSSAQAQQELMWPYHPEDEFIAKHATHTHTFAYSSSPPRKGSATDSEEVATSDSFGVETRGQVMLLELAKFNEMVDGLEGYVGAAAAVMDQS